jgi:hypothetical protein
MGKRTREDHPRVASARRDVILMGGLTPLWSLGVDDDRSVNGSNRFKWVCTSRIHALVVVCERGY